ncbi:MAG: PAS domain S-box protein, partial [Polynucleobacter sp.]|nr:PAS domain S-box protein [Polynucleobacter sp.]
STAKTLASLPENIQLLHPLPIPRRDEIGELIGGFNRLLASLSEKDAHLRESEERYRAFFQYSPDAILVYRDYVTIFVNDAAVRLFHADSAAALIGRRWKELVAPEDWTITEARVDALNRGDVSSLPPLERRYRAFDGTIIMMESAISNIIFDGKPAVIAVLRDVTQRRQSEAQRLAEAQQHRVTLVREVHHRIKNNLQSVAGLLQRELGKFVELDPRLKTAIGQVHAIALVHGLQSTNPDEAIRLCDSIRSICNTAAELSQYPVNFHLENEYTCFKPTRIENSEAVPVALVLNELIFNAVKHSPIGVFTPTVSLSAKNGKVQMTIRNALKEAPDTALLGVKNLGTGLRLVHSLLPKEGAELTYEIDAEGFMLTRLELVAPVVNLRNRRKRTGHDENTDCR